MKELAAIGNHESYMNWALNIPNLSREEEYELGRRKDEENDIDAAQELIYSHLKLVIKIAKQNMGYKVPMEDLIQEGNIGLMRAVKKYDYKLGYRLMSFAGIHILEKIRDCAVCNTKIMKVATTKAQRKLFFGLKTTLSEVSNLPIVQQYKYAADKHDVPLKDVQEMHQRLICHDQSTNEQAYITTEGTMTVEEALPSNEISIEEAYENEDYEAYKNGIVSDFMETLDDRYRDVFTSRKFTEPPVKFQVLSDRYGVSKQYIAQIETKCIDRLEKFVSERIN